MSTYEKVVKLACKPKLAPPKAKYLDPIIAATYSDDGAIHDVCRALTPRFREPNAIVVFKALIVLHSMVRNGSTDNILSYLSSAEILRLHNVGQGQWEGYDTPQNLANYAAYLDARIKAYSQLKHDAIRVQSESNRDLRASEDGFSQQSQLRRSKTIGGRKLRVMTVEKGLLRETKIVQKMIDSLLNCRFYHESLKDELTITALRMLVKDLLVLFQAGNEGVINVLEHYFEMSHMDAEASLAIYRHFCKQTEKVVEYLLVAKKLQNILNVQIPNLKHAPVSLAGSLEEYLRDPNFEQNRLEYKRNKEVADGKKPSGSTPVKDTTAVTTSTASNPSSSTPAASGSATPAPVPAAASAPSRPEISKDITDFFSSIEQEQSNMFNPRTNSPTNAYFTQQAAFNPFVQRQSMMPQMTGFPGQQPQPFMQPSPFGPVQSQPTGFPSQQQQPQQQPFQPFMQPAMNGGLQFPQSSGFLQPQMTGANPFRQSMLLPQTTGFPGMNNTNANAPFARPMSAFGGPTSLMSSNPLSSPFGTAPPSANQPAYSTPARPASTPIGTAPSTQQSLAPAAPLLPQNTSSRNPFGPPPAPAQPPAPKEPTLMEIAFGQTQTGFFGQAASQPQQQPSLSTPSFSFTAPEASNNAAPAQGGNPWQMHAPQSQVSSIASSFATGSGQGAGVLNSSGASANSNPNPGSGSAFSQLSNQTGSNSTMSGSLSSGFSAGAGGSSATTPSISSLRPQPTGFGGSNVKPFRPTSSFGASLLESLPQASTPTQAQTQTQQPQTQSATTNPSSAFSQFSGMSNGQQNGVGAQPTGMGANLFSGSRNTLMGGASGLGGGMGGGMQPQFTGTPNPFRASMFGTGTAGMSSTAGMSPMFSPNGAGEGMNGMPNANGPSFGGSSFFSTGSMSAPGGPAGGPANMNGTMNGAPNGFGGVFGPNSTPQNAQQNSVSSLI